MLFLFLIPQIKIKALATFVRFFFVGFLFLFKNVDFFIISRSIRREVAADCCRGRPTAAGSGGR